MPFDPDQYLAQKLGQTAPSGGFDPNKYLAEKTGQAPIAMPADSVFASKDDRFRPNAPMAALNALGQGATLGLAPIGAAGLSAALSVLKGDTSPSNFGDAYRTARDDIKNKQQVLEQAYPKTTFGGELAGGLLPALATGGESAVPTLAKSLKTGAAAGGILGFANSPADLSKGQLEQTLYDTGKGALLGAGTGGLFHGVMQAISPEALNEFANNRVVKATGIAKPAYKKLVANDQVDDVGQRLWDTKVVRPGSSPSDILENAQNAKQQFGQNIDKNLQTFDASGKVSTLPDPAKMSQAVQDQLKVPLLGPDATTPYKTVASQNNVVNNIIDDINSHGVTPMPFDDAQKLKLMLKQAAFSPTGEISDTNAYKAYGIVNKEIENAAEKTADASGVPGLKDEYINNKKNYGAADIAERAALGKVSAEGVNRDLSLTDYIAGTAAAAAHGGPGFAAGSITNKLARSYGNSVAAGAGKGAAAIFSLPKQGLQTFATSLANQGETGQKLSQILLQAADRDDVGKNALLFTLMQQPIYRQLIDSHTNSQESTPGGQGGGQ